MHRREKGSYPCLDPGKSGTSPTRYFMRGSKMYTIPRARMRATRTYSRYTKAMPMATRAMVKRQADLGEGSMAVHSSRRCSHSLSLSYLSHYFLLFPVSFVKVPFSFILLNLCFSLLNFLLHLENYLASASLSQSHNVKFILSSPALTSSSRGFARCGSQEVVYRSREQGDGRGGEERQRHSR